MSGSGVFGLFEISHRHDIDALFLAAHRHLNRHGIAAGIGSDDHHIALFNVVGIIDDIGNARRLFHRAGTLSTKRSQSIRVQHRIDVT